MALRSFVALLVLVAPACGLLGRRPAKVAEVPEWACAAKEANLVGFHATAEQEKEAAKAEDEKIATLVAAKKKTTPEEQAEYEAAREEIIELTGQMKEAKARYAQAVSAMLTVPSVDGAAVTATLEKKEQDQFVVFYAPWCPHCQTFVLGNQQGIPDKAPLELLAKELEPHKDTLKVLRFDTQAHGDSIPEGFDVQYIPTIYLAAADGTKTKYEGAPDPAALKAFIKEHATKTKM